MSEGLSWTAIAAIVPLVLWMLAGTTSQAIVWHQLKQLMTNHLPHIEKKLDLLLQGGGVTCRQHEREIKELKSRIHDLEAHTRDCPRPCTKGEI